MQSLSRCLNFILVGLACVPSLGAQVAKPDSTAIRFAKTIRRSDPGVGIDVLTILGQDRGQRSSMELRAISDSLVAIANSRGAVPLETRRELVSQIGYSGSARHSVPFADAGRVLQRILADGDTQVTTTVVTAVRSLANKQEAVRILTQVAESKSKDSAAGVAVMLLFSAKEISVEGKQALRQMWARGSVTQKDALEAITFFAQKEGWPPARE